MRNTALVFFLGLSFVIYWLITADSRDSQASLGTQLPALIRVDTTGIRSWLMDEALKLGRADRNPTKAVVQMKQKALTLKPEEVRVLRDTSLSPSASGDERFLAVYIISLAESSQARVFLKEIAQTPLPQTANERAYSDEVVVRANALEAAVQKMSKEESKLYLEQLLAKSPDPSLERHARYWLSRL